MITTMRKARRASLRWSDWVKVGIVMAAALPAWYYVDRAYQEPFDLVAEVRRQQLVADYESTSPLVRRVPLAGGGQSPAIQLPAR